MRQDRAPVQDRVVARRQDYGFQTPAVSSNAGELEGLVKGLSSLNQSLGQYTQEAVAKQQDELKRITEAEAARRAAEADLTRTDVQGVVAQDLPANVPPAYGQDFRESLGALLVDRAAIKAKQDWAAEYEEASKAEDFNPDQFIQGFRKKALGGLTDPALIGRMGKQLSEMEGSLRADAEKKRLARLDETVTAGLFTSFQENFRGDMSAEQIGAVYTQNLPAWRSLGRTPKELAGLLLGRMTYLSTAKGGDPSVFDVFDTKTDNGQTLLASNPELAPQIMAAREQARALNQRNLEEASQKANLPTMNGLNKQLEDNPTSITEELVLSNMGKHGVFPTTEAAASFLARARAKAVEKGLEGDLMGAFDKGILGRFKPEDQRKVLEARLGPVITQTWQEAVNGNPAAATGLATAVMQAQSMSKATVPVDAIKRLVESTVTSQASPDGPDGTFQAVVELYKGFSADPKFRDMYFSEDERTVMDQFIKDTSRGGDAQGAYTAAFNSISPQAKAAAEAFTKTEEFKTKVKDATGSVVGSGWSKWIGGKGSIVNTIQVETDAQAAVRDFLSRRPYAGADEVNEFVGSWVSKNYIMDEATNVAIKVPPQLADETTKDALTEYTRRVTDTYRLNDRNDGEWKVQYRPMGDQGLLQVVLSDGSSEQNMGILPLQTLRDSFVAEKAFNAEVEIPALRTLQQQVASGDIDVAFVEANATLIAKAKKLQGLPAETIKRLEKLQMDTVKARLDQMPKLNLGTPTLDNLQHVPTRGNKVDNKLTATVAKSMFGAPGSAPHHSKAASLITMGEAVVLKAYPDPAKDAGNNIGMGYNLKANAKTVHEDLRRADVPKDRIQAVIDGTAQLTPQQAQRLLLVTMPRYEKLVMDTAEKTAPGLWRRMSPQQKAVMIDVAWQTGNPGQFRKAWGAMASGDVETFRNETKVFYTDRNGVKKEDKRRNDLRAAMLNGDAQWLAVIDKYGNFPATAMEAFALNQPK